MSTRGTTTLLAGHLTEEQETFNGSVARLVGSTTASADSNSVLTLAGAQGFLGIAVPEEYGGSSTDDFGFGLVFASNAMAAGLTGVAFRYGMHAWVAAPFLAHHASDAQQARWLPAIASGACLASVVGIRKSTNDILESRDEDGTLHLTGTFENVPGAAEAQLLLIAVNTPTPQVVLVETGDIERKPVGDGSGVPGMASADIAFCNLVVPAANRVAVTGACAVDSLRTDYYLWLAALGVTGAQAALRNTVQYVQERRVFGRPLAEFENTRHSLAGVAVALAGASALLDDSVSARAHSAITPAAAAAAALAATAAYSRSVDHGLQLHGGYGYMREYPISQAYADAMRIRLETGDAAAWISVATALGLTST